MSKMPKRIYARGMSYGRGNWMSKELPLTTRYVRADIADTMQDALQRFMDATDNVDGDTKGEKLIQIMRSRFSKAIAKAEGKA